MQLTDSFIRSLTHFSLQYSHATLFLITDWKLGVGVSEFTDVFFLSAFIQDQYPKCVCVCYLCGTRLHLWGSVCVCLSHVRPVLTRSSTITVMNKLIQLCTLRATQIYLPFIKLSCLNSDETLSVAFDFETQAQINICSR